MKNQTTESTSNFDFSSANLPETFNNKPESETIEFVKPLKHPTQQKRVELIEKQKWELIAATATIDNQAATIKDLQKTMAELEKIRLELIERNSNLKRITNDQTERIEILQHENKNYESAIKVIETNYKESSDKLIEENKALNSGITELETKYNSLSISMDNLEIAHEKEIANLKESRELIAKTNTKLYKTVFIFGLVIAIESLVIWAN